MTYEMKEQAATFSEIAIARAVKRIATQIGTDYGDLSQLALVGVMDGAIHFLADLMRELRTQPSGELIHITTARLESYQGTGPEGVKCIWLPSQVHIRARNVLIVEDIVNTGATCRYLKLKLLEFGAESVRICSLLDNVCALNRVDVEVDYAGFKVQDPLWVGHGLDFKGAYRNLPCVRRLKYP